MSYEIEFFSPLQSAGSGDNQGDSREKRPRMEELDDDGPENEGSSLGRLLPNIRNVDEEEIEVLEIDEDRVDEGGDEYIDQVKTDEEILEAMKELRVHIRKMKFCTESITAFCKEGQPEANSKTKSYNRQMAVQIESADRTVRMIVLMLENKDLRRKNKRLDKFTQSGSEIRNTSTQYSPKGEISREERGIVERNRNNEVGGNEDRNELGTMGRRGEGEGLARRNLGEVVGEEWQQIERKRNSKKQKEAIENKKKKEEEDRKNRERERRVREMKGKTTSIPRAEALIIKASGEKSYADLFKDLRKGAGENLKGIQKVRKSRAGDLIIEMEKNSNTLGMEKIVKETLGVNHTVRRMSPKILFEIKEVDPSLDRDEAKDEIAKLFGIKLEDVEIRSMRYGYDGTKMIIVNLPASVGEKVSEEKEIRLGFTSCKIKRTWNIIRCFKCHEFGHMTYTCKKELAGKEICRKCGHPDHHISNCTAEMRCILCIKEGIPEARAGHIAGASNCPQFKKYLQLVNGRNN